jgi:hypothetical protein
LSSGDILVHSPCPVDDALTTQVRKIGPLSHIIAPGSYHYFHVSAWQDAFPDATTWICPGVERKSPDLDFDWLLSDHSPETWASEIDQVLVRGNRFIWEVAFLDKPSKTLVLTDLVENIGEQTQGTNWVLKLWWKVVMNMWDKPKPAPEYQMGWSHKASAKRSLERILEWDFERVVIAHGENLDSEPRRDCRRLQSLRGWSHGTNKQVFPRGPRASGPAGLRARRSVRLPVGGDLLDRGEDRMLG